MANKPTNLELLTEISNKINGINKPYSILYPFSKFQPLLNKVNKLHKEYEYDRESVKDNMYVAGLEFENKDLQYRLNEALDELHTTKQRISKVGKELGLIAGTVQPQPIQNCKELYVVDDVVSWEKIEIALQAGLNYLLFENSVRTQWIDVFNGKTPSKPIQIKEGTTLKIFCYVLDQFAEKEVIKKRYTSNLTKLQAFEFAGKPITFNQLKQARKDYTKNGISRNIEIENQLNALLELIK